MVPLPTAEDCARHDYSGGSPPGDGLLPIPQPHGQARALSKRSPFPSKMPSIFSTPPTRRTPAASLSPMVKPKISRSTSAILPTPLAGSPPLVEGDGLHLLKGRLPFKIVQGNGPGNNKIDVVQRNNSMKPLDARNGAHKKMVVSSGHAVNVKVKDHVDGHQGARSTVKPPHDGADLKGKPKKADVRNQRSLERSHSVKGPHERRAQQVEIPAVTILQTPKNEEAAAELFAKFFQKSAEQDIECVNEEWVDCTPENMDSEIEQQSSTEGLSDFEALEDGPRQTISSPFSTTGVSGTVVNKYVGGSPLRLTVSSTLVTQSDVEIFSASKGALKELMLESIGEELAPWERWAGPSYINSPPPSALPLPRFSRKHLKVESLATADFFDEIGSDQASTPPSSISPLYASFSGKRQLGINSDAVASATKDLKRILNLDLCRM